MVDKRRGGRRRVKILGGEKSYSRHGGRLWLCRGVMFIGISCGVGACTRNEPAKGGSFHKFPLLSTTIILCASNQKVSLCVNIILALLNDLRLRSYKTTKATAMFTDAKVG